MVSHVFANDNNKNKNKKKISRDQCIKRELAFTVSFTTRVTVSIVLFPTVSRVARVELKRASPNPTLSFTKSLFDKSEASYKKRTCHEKNENENEIINNNNNNQKPNPQDRVPCGKHALLDFLGFFLLNLRFFSFSCRSFLYLYLLARRTVNDEIVL
jgi:hypothetical protein